MSDDDESILILVVDDDEGLRNTIAEVLADDGYRVLTAANGQEAIAVLERSRPQFMLLDLMMPVMNGWQLIEWMNGDRARRVSYCVMTAVPNQAPTGPQPVLAKPMRLDALLEMVKSHAGGER